MLDKTEVDMNLPDIPGLEVLEKSKELDPELLVITGYASVESAVRALKLGAYDYIKKPFKADVIKLILGLALEAQKLRKPVGVLKSRLKLPAHLNIIAESELFGYEKGAFTDAHQRRKGLFEAADGGTVFLDEIGEMPMKLQAKLLGVLEKKRFRRLGGHRDIEIDVRIIAATNRDPIEAMHNKEFREDLYYRLNVFPIQIPPLRERPEDVLALAHFFLFQFTRQFHKGFREIDEQAAAYLKRYAWPGNVRELRNVLERTCIMYDDTTLKVAHLPPEIVSFQGLPSFIAIPDQLFDIAAVVAEVTRELIQRALEKTDGNTAQASRLLGIPRGTLRYKMKKFKIEG
ncbi:MAG: sigma-54 dependent transcriptional regulator [Desulfobacterales bacterium]